MNHDPLVLNDPMFASPRLQSLLGPVRESKLEDYLHKRVKALGGDYRRVSWIGRNAATDDLILLPGRHFLCEVKRPGKKATPAQEREHDRLRAAGFEVHVVSTHAEIDALLPPPVESAP